MNALAACVNTWKKTIVEKHCVVIVVRFRKEMLTMANEVRLIDANRITYQVAYLPTTQGAEKVWAATEQDIENVLTIDPESLRPKGRWKMRGGKRYCTNCGKRACVTRDSDDFWYTVGTDYCPNCGAKMEG